MSSLFQRLFIAPLAEEEDEAEAVERERQEVIQFLGTPYFEKVLARLGEIQEQNDPRPGSHENMLYQSGVRDGIKLVRQYLDALVDSVRG